MAMSWEAVSAMIDGIEVRLSESGRKKNRRTFDEYRSRLDLIVTDEDADRLANEFCAYVGSQPSCRKAARCFFPPYIVHKLRQVHAIICKLERKLPKAKRPSALPADFDGHMAASLIRPGGTRVSDDEFKRQWPKYLKSPWWQKRREQAIRQAEERCEHCGKTREQARCDFGDDLNVHHLRYERLGQEKDGDLEVLCYECHKREHREQWGGIKMGFFEGRHR